MNRDSAGSTASHCHPWPERLPQLCSPWDQNHEYYCRHNEDQRGYVQFCQEHRLLLLPSVIVAFSASHIAAAFLTSLSWEDQNSVPQEHH